VAQGQLEVKGKNTEEKKGDICPGEEVLPRRRRGEGEAGKESCAEVDRTQVATFLNWPLKFPPAGTAIRPTR